MVRPKVAAEFVGTLLLGTIIVAGSLKLWRDWLHPLTGDDVATCIPRCFCELPRLTGLAQPVNTWSCVAFVWLGLLMLLDIPRLRRNAPLNGLGARPVNAAVFALALLLTGVGSALFHASLTFFGQFLDVLGMYFLSTFIVLYQVNRIRPLSSATTITSYVVLNLALAVGLWTVPELRRWAFAVTVICIIALEVLARRTPRNVRGAYFFAAVGTLAVGFVIWVLDNMGVLCAPTSLFQGHAIWHLSGAVACALLYAFFRTETVVARAAE